MCCWTADTASPPPAHCFEEKKNINRLYIGLIGDEEK